MKITIPFFSLTLFFSLAFNTSSSSQTAGKPLFMPDKDDCLKSASVRLLTYQNHYYPGHRSGIEIIQNGSRIISSLDLRINPIPIPDGVDVKFPEFEKRETDPVTGEVRMFADYQAYRVHYILHLIPDGNTIRLKAELDKPLSVDQPLYVMMEIYPEDYFGQSWILDNQQGIFPRQYTGRRTVVSPGDTVSIPMATGRSLTIAPGDELKQFSMVSETGTIELHDGRASTNHKWFVVMEKLPSGKSGIVAEWILKPKNVPGFHSAPVIGISRTGYHPLAEKKVVIELDPDDPEPGAYKVWSLGGDGKKTEVLSGNAVKYGSYLNKKYMTADLTDLHKEGIYIFTLDAKYRERFVISARAYGEDLWKTTLGTFLPVQMCHMNVADRIRLWHSACHMDDAVQAPDGTRNWLGYYQDTAQTYSHNPLEHINGLTRGGWHDAGDFQLPTGSNAKTVYNLCLTFEEFGPLIDETSVDNTTHSVVLHAPDAIPDIIEQIIHGVNYILAGYRNDGYAYPGVISGNWLQYLQLGEAEDKTDNLVDQENDEGDYHDDRYVFTGRNGNLEFNMAAVLSSAYRVLHRYNPDLAAECLHYAEKAYRNGQDFTHKTPGSYISGYGGNLAVEAAVEMYLTTGDRVYIDDLSGLLESDNRFLYQSAWALSRLKNTGDFTAIAGKTDALMKKYKDWLKSRLETNPYGVPLEKSLFGLGYFAMDIAMNQYYLHQYFPEMFSDKPVFDILNYMTGVHPANNLSLVTGIGSESMTSAFGFNRSDFSYIPGGVIPGPAWMNPGLFELRKNDPFLWIQTEYTIGGASDFIFLANAADKLIVEHFR